MKSNTVPFEHSMQEGAEVLEVLVKQLKHPNSHGSHFLVIIEYE